MWLQNFKPKGFDEAPQMKHKGYFFPNPDGETTVGKWKLHEESIIENERGRAPSPLELGVRHKRDRPPDRSTRPRIARD